MQAAACCSAQRTWCWEQPAAASTRQCLLDTAVHAAMGGMMQSMWSACLLCVRFHAYASAERTVGMTWGGSWQLLFVRFHAYVSAERTVGMTWGGSWLLHARGRPGPRNTRRLLLVGLSNRSSAVEHAQRQEASTHLRGARGHLGGRLRHCAPIRRTQGQRYAGELAASSRARLSCVCVCVYVCVRSCEWVPVCMRVSESIPQLGSLIHLKHRQRVPICLQGGDPSPQRQCLHAT